MLYIAILTGLLFPTLGRAEVTPENLRKIYERAHAATTDADRASVETEYQALVAEASALLPAVERARGPIGTFVVRQPLRGNRLTTANLRGLLPNGVYLMSDVEGHDELFSAENVQMFGIMRHVNQVRIADRMAYRFANVKFDDETSWIIVEKDWTKASILQEPAFTTGRRPSDAERAAVIKDDKDKETLVFVGRIFPGGVFEAKEQLFDGSRGRSNPQFPAARWIESHPARSGWSVEGGSAWPVETIGRYNGREVYIGKDGPHFVGEFASSVEKSPLVGQAVVHSRRGFAPKFVRVAFELDTGAIVTERGEYIPKSEFSLDEDGKLADRILKRHPAERVVDAFFFLPTNFVRAIFMTVRRLQTAVHGALARWMMPKESDGELVLSSRQRPVDPAAGIRGQRIKAGDPSRPLVRTAREFARKFGVKTYVKPPLESDTNVAFVRDANGEIIATFQADASRRTLAHERVHVKNTHARVVRRRLNSQNNGFHVSKDKGYRFFEDILAPSYQTYFRADEARARAAELLVILGDLAIMESPRDRAVIQVLVDEGWEKLARGRSFLTTMDAEIPLLREAVRADGGAESVHQSFDRFFIRRPLVRRSPDEAKWRNVIMTSHWTTWQMNREKRMAFALERLDDLARDNARSARLFERLERRLEKYGKPSMPIEIMLQNCEDELVGDAVAAVG